MLMHQEVCAIVTLNKISLQYTGTCSKSTMQSLEDGMHTYELSYNQAATQISNYTKKVPTTVDYLPYRTATYCSCDVQHQRPELHQAAWESQLAVPAAASRPVAEHRAAFRL